MHLEYPNLTCIKHDTEEVIIVEKLKAKLNRAGRGNYPQGEGKT